MLHREGASKKNWSPARVLHEKNASQKKFMAQQVLKITHILSLRIEGLWIFENCIFRIFLEPP